MYVVKRGELYEDERKLGKSEKIYVDGRQDVADYVKRSNRKGFAVAKLQEGDYAMVSKTGKTIGIEEKKPPDFCNSLRSRRLQRQLRRLEKSVDIPVLALRFIRSPKGDIYKPDWWQLNNLNVTVELLKWDIRGAIIFLPADEDKLLSTLTRVRNILQPGSHLHSIVAGSDVKRVEDTTPFSKLVRRVVDGVGAKSAKRLEEHYGSDIWALFKDDEDGWKEAGLHVGQRRTLAELLRGNYEGKD